MVEGSKCGGFFTSVILKRALFVSSASTEHRHTSVDPAALISPGSKLPGQSQECESIHLMKRIRDCIRRPANVPSWRPAKPLREQKNAADFSLYLIPAGRGRLSKGWRARCCAC